MLSHREINDKLKNKILLPSDYSRAVGREGLTDFVFNSATKTIGNDSKYVITSAYRHDGKKNPYIYYFPLMELYQELKERFIDKNKGYDLNRNRIIGHFEDERVLRFGNKEDNFRIELKEAMWLYPLVSRENYPKKLIHKMFQEYLIVLGMALGYDVKIAKGDKKGILKHSYYSDYNLLSINDLKLPDYIENVSEERTDNIDVIWFDKENNKIFSAFEVELSNNIELAMNRLAEVNNIFYKKYNHFIIPVIVGESKDFGIVVKKSKLETMKKNFNKSGLWFLSTENLERSLLYINDIRNNNSLLRNLISNLIIDVYNYGKLN